MTKAELRKTYLGKRKELSDAECQRLSQAICDRFFGSVNLSKIHVLHSFLPIQKNKEVNTWLIIERVKLEFPDVQISIPRMNNHTSELEHYYYEGRDQMRNNTFEIPEPIQGIPTPIDKLDAVLVPLLAFDKQGHRLGYGRGFYDRFLAGCRSDCLKIGLSFFGVIEKIEGISDKDVSLDLIVTPETIVTPESGKQSH